VPHFPHFPPAPESILLKPLEPLFPIHSFSQFLLFFLPFFFINYLLLSYLYISNRLEVQKFAFLGKFILAHQVFSKSLEKAFFMEPASPPSSDSPEHPGEYIRREWQRRTFNVETCFNIVDAFREKESVKWAYRQFKKRNLVSLLKPSGDFFYPPFVRVFYQNLTYDTNNPAYLSSIILGQQVYVSVDDIARALGCPTDDPRGQFGVYPQHCDLHFIIRDMFEGVYCDDRRTCTKRAQLPHHLLLVDLVLKKNVCPLGHKTQRIGDVLAALYALERKYWVSIPELIWRQLHNCWEDMIEKRLASATQRPLPFPCLITKLVVSNGIPIPERALLDRNIPVFGLAQWMQSISNMPQLGEPQVAMEVDDGAPAAEQHKDEQSAPRQASVQSTPTYFSLLQGQLDTLASEMRDTRAEILARQSAMEDMLRQILGRLPPPLDAAP